ncbi:hypothetical protein ABK040_009146 [Willaertia magna]
MGVDNIEPNKRIKMPEWVTNKFFAPLGNVFYSPFMKQFIYAPLGEIVKFALGIIIAAGAVDQLNKSDAQSRESFEIENEILKRHREYSKCMELVAAFKLANQGEQIYKGKSIPTYAQVFIEGMNEAPRKPEIFKINECKSLTKDWWELVQRYDEKYQLQPETKRQRYFERFQRFKDLIEPLDHLDGYNEDVEHKVYEYDILKRRQ